MRFKSPFKSRPKLPEPPKTEEPARRNETTPPTTPEKTRRKSFTSMFSPSAFKRNKGDKPDKKGKKEIEALRIELDAMKNEVNKQTSDIAQLREELTTKDAASDVLKQKFNYQNLKWQVLLDMYLLKMVEVDASMQQGATPPAAQSPEREVTATAVSPAGTRASPGGYQRIDSSFRVASAVGGARAPAKGGVVSRALEEADDFD